MSYIGKVENGVVVLPPEAALADGCRVEIRPLGANSTQVESVAESESPTLAEMFKDFIGVVEGPPDLARNHDHYIHGTAKQ